MVRRSVVVELITYLVKEFLVLRVAEGMDEAPVVVQAGQDCGKQS